MKKSLLTLAAIAAAFAVYAQGTWKTPNEFINIPKVEFSTTDITELNATICYGGSYDLNGRIFTQTGTYTDTLISQNGNDSIVMLHLTVLPVYNDTINVTIYVGEIYNFNGHLLTISGIYRETLVAQNGCDSIITLHLSVLTPDTPIISVPYFCGFEYATENAQWVLNAGNAAIINLPQFKNKWKIGTGARKSGFNGMYIHFIDDTGIEKVGYDSVGMFTVAYREFQLPAGNYELAFNWRALGDSISDALYVYWVPAAFNPQSGITTTLPTTLNSYKLVNTKTGKNYMSDKASWQQATANITAATGGNKLVFIWLNNTKRTFNPGACIDNIQIVKRANTTDCWQAPTNLKCVSYPDATNPTHYQLTWDSVADADSYDVVYFLNGSSKIDTVFSVTNSTLISMANFNSGLYTFLVRAKCATNTSLYSELSTIIVTTELLGGISDGNGIPKINLDCSVNSYTLSPDLSNMPSYSGAGYSVSSVAYAPHFPFAPAAYAQKIFGNNMPDDSWSNIISLPFDFRFFENTYNQIQVGANGQITFDISHPAYQSATNPYSFEGNLPVNPLNDPPATFHTTAFYKVLNSIFGVYEDIDPSRCTGNEGVYAGVLGEYPYRTFCVLFYNIPLFGNNLQKNSYQIAMYEGTNIIDVYVQNRNCCSTTNSGKGVIAVVNADATNGAVARNTNDPLWTAQNEAWRFTPIGNITMSWYKGAGFEGEILGYGTDLTINKGINLLDTITVRVQNDNLNIDIADTVVIDWGFTVTNLYDTITLPLVELQWNDINLPDLAGSYVLTDTLISSSGCDSIIILNLEVLPAVVIDANSNSENIVLTLNIPINIAITGGTFTVTLPAGISIDIANCILSALLAGNYDLTISDSGNGSWVFTLTPKPFYANSMRIIKQTANYQDILYIAYTVSADLADGSYTAVISDLHFIFADETEIIQNELPVIISVKEETGINNIITNSIKIFPNPAKSELYINFSSFENSESLSVEITDLSGRTIMVNSKLSNGKSINVSALPAGVYFVKITTDKGAVTQKFIKE